LFATGFIIPVNKDFQNAPNAILATKRDTAHGGSGSPAGFHRVASRRKGANKE